MQTIRSLVVSLGLIVLLSASVRAQGAGLADRTLLILKKSVQEELKMSVEQAKKIDLVAEDMRLKDRGEMRKLLALPDGLDRLKKIQNHRRTLDQDFRKKIDTVLTPEQSKRFDQIYLQQLSGTVAFTKPLVQEALKLSDEQKAKIGKIGVDWVTELGKLHRDSRGRIDVDDSKKVAELADRVKAKAIDLLTDDQKAAWNQLIGKPFEVK